MLNYILTTVSIDAKNWEDIVSVAAILSYKATKQWKNNASLTFAAVKQVLRFDISVGDIHCVQVLKRSRDLVDDFRSFALREGVFRSLLNPGEKLPAFHAFHHNQQDSRAIVDVFVNINNPETEQRICHDS